MTDNPARPKPGTAIFNLAELPDRSAACLHFEEAEARFSLIVARQGNRVFAYENRCPHARYPMEKLDGTVLVQDGRFLVCSAHGASFQMQDGAFAGGPGDGTGLTPVPVSLEGETVRIA
jgi:nitrite reductase/ring-hydroxylating ferredoxin subunit